eukprot:1514284-Amphidinium_carterae.1
MLFRLGRHLRVALLQAQHAEIPGGRHKIPAFHKRYIAGLQPGHVAHLGQRVLACPQGSINPTTFQLSFPLSQSCYPPLKMIPPKKSQTFGKRSTHKSYA